MPETASFGTGVPLRERVSLLRAEPRTETSLAGISKAGAPLFNAVGAPRNFAYVSGNASRRCSNGTCRRLSRVKSARIGVA